MVAELPKVGFYQKKNTQSHSEGCVFFLFRKGDDLNLLLEKILINDNFFHHYQPIYDIQNNDIIGYEGLFRTTSNLTPEYIFLRAKKRKMLYELDSRSVHKAFLTYINADYSLRFKNLFINVFPTTLTNPWFQTLINKIINENHISSQQITFEINENEAFDFREITKAISYFKDIGIQIALDDFGKGNASIKSMIELNPDFVKLDRYFVEDLIYSEKKQNTLSYIQYYCEKFNSKLIVEGIEDELSLRFLKNIGVKYAQGFFLGRPKKI